MWCTPRSHSHEEEVRQPCFIVPERSMMLDNKGMKYLPLLALVVLVGCGEPNSGNEAVMPPANTAAPGANAQTGAGSGGNSVGITSPAAGLSSPVTGSDSVGGASAGGVGMAAKDQARRVAGGENHQELPDDGN